MLGAKSMLKQQMQRSAVAFALISESLLAATIGVSPASAQEPAAARSTPVTPVERFEGYVWLDADGQPLPFQSDDAIEAFLVTAAVDSVEKIPVGITRPKKVLLVGDGVRAHTIFKDVEENKKKVKRMIAGRRHVFMEWRDSHIYDVAAYQLDRLLRLDRVPPAVPRKIRQIEGSVKIWVEGSTNDKTRRDREIDPPDFTRWTQQRQIMHIFDNLVANRDSNLGNTLIDGNWRLWFVDCGRCFGTTRALLYPEAIGTCERGLWQELQNLDEARVRERLGPYLTRYEMDALLVRRDKLVEHLQGLIDASGEASVLFDLRPPTERAPWVDD